MDDALTTCGTCSADWSQGNYKQDCAECGGGALTRDCPCGQCGGVWKRMVMDSHDAREAHWLGSCLLPKKVQQEIMKQQAQAPAKQNKKKP